MRVRRNIKNGIEDKRLKSRWWYEKGLILKKITSLVTFKWKNITYGKKFDYV